MIEARFRSTAASFTDPIDLLIIILQASTFSNFPESVIARCVKGLQVLLGNRC